MLFSVHGQDPAPYELYLQEIVNEHCCGDHQDAGGLSHGHRRVILVLIKGVIRIGLDQWLSAHDLVQPVAMLIQGRVQTECHPGHVTGEINLVVGELNIRQDSHKDIVTYQRSSQVIAVPDLVDRNVAPLLAQRILTAVVIIIVHGCGSNNGGAIIVRSKSNIRDEFKVIRGGQVVVSDNQTAIVGRVLDSGQSNNSSGRKAFSDFNQSKIMSFDVEEFRMNNGVYNCVVQLVRGVIVGQVTCGNVDLGVVGGELRTGRRRR